MKEMKEGWRDKILMVTLWITPWDYFQRRSFRFFCN